MRQTHCEDGTPRSAPARVVLVGTPNVGKSVLFNRLTGRYVVVSNYPGTTVEVTRGQARIGDVVCEVIDTPGMYSLSPITEEERVARALLLQQQPDVVIHVVDAKNLGRMLALTLQLLEAGLPVILLLNMMDEAERLHLHIDHHALAKRLGIPVIPASLISGRGVEELKNIVGEYLSNGQNRSVSTAD
ncbi:MAG: 50S ribosome-binding GTPase [bacterium]|nr:50S ribosome-binding GTPase [bacterium]MCS7309786.1 50S ribosome-binding GTPase [Armatimonadota bacterium]MDW8104567.1 FeoB small GTPase domain-containing protein [Armatimonadota bacterium]MDW8322221.1 FeoB small GTPase domain-containing protein [Armatimonadota bacterium]MDW8322255.1 FeoB small GTPase domain-containing protein [Armatimonadota bacterium]